MSNNNNESNTNVSGSPNKIKLMPLVSNQNQLKPAN
jgi:hypothetical protein